MRRVIGEPKELLVDNGWSDRDLPPRHAPIFARTRPMRAGWRWRSARAQSVDGAVFVLLALVNPRRDNWQAMLMREQLGHGWSVVARFEHHGSHPGLHVHGHCERSGIETGASGLDNLLRVPSARTRHRRSLIWTEASFWEAAKRFFRIGEKKGPVN